jgi:hypothetical protein
VSDEPAFKPGVDAGFLRTSPGASRYGSARFGTKAAIARELNDLIDEEAAVAGFVGRIAAEADPAELIRLTLALNRALHEQCGDIIAAVRSAGAVDPAIAAVYAEGTRRHDDGPSADGSVPFIHTATGQFAC